MTEPAGVRIGAWSGPRNISTALMRSWDSRADTIVCDEPLYAYYLRETGAAHPLADTVLAHHDSDWQRVVAGLVGPVPGGRAISYQKHMAHHLVGDIRLDWIAALRNFLLIRDPVEVLASLAQRYPDAGAADTGLPQQVRLFDWLADRTGAPPPVLDARDVLEDPQAALSALCASLGVGFDAAMLAWRPGPRPTDGVWAPAWYDRVLRTTGFEPPRARPAVLPPRLAAVEEQCRPLYDKLRRHRLVPHRE